MIDLSTLAVAELLPHSGKMVWIDSIIDVDHDSLTAEVRVQNNAMLPITANNLTVPAWIGLEYMAQAIGAYAGIQAKQNHAPIQLGFLLGTRMYTSSVSELKIGSLLTITVKKIFQDNQLGVFDCVISGEDVRICANLNVYQPPLGEN